MCSRYYIDDDLYNEVTDLVENARQAESRMPAGDICPGEYAPVITGKQENLRLDRVKWGFPYADRKGLIINARVETALDKKLFHESVLHRRCVMPARHFYEWDSDKAKASFSHEDGSVLFLAGFYDLAQDGERFVILTTAANSSVVSVHDRMPLVLEKGQVRQWVCDGGAVADFLQITPPLLRKCQEYEQQSLFDWQ